MRIRIENIVYSVSKAELVYEMSGPATHIDIITTTGENIRVDTEHSSFALSKVLGELAENGFSEVVKV